MRLPPDRTAHTTAFDGPCGPLVGTENSSNCKYSDAGSIRHVGGSKPLQKSALPPELRPAPWWKYKTHCHLTAPSPYLTDTKMNPGACIHFITPFNQDGDSRRDNKRKRVKGATEGKKINANACRYCNANATRMHKRSPSFSQQHCHLRQICDMPGMSNWWSHEGHIGDIRVAMRATIAVLTIK